MLAFKKRHHNSRPFRYQPEVIFPVKVASGSGTFPSETEKKMLQFLAVNEKSQDPFESKKRARTQDKQGRHFSF